MAQEISAGTQVGRAVSKREQRRELWRAILADNRQADSPQPGSAKSAGLM